MPRDPQKALNNWPLALNLPGNFVLAIDQPRPPDCILDSLAAGSDGTLVLWSENGMAPSHVLPLPGAIREGFVLPRQGRTDCLLPAEPRAALAWTRHLHRQHPLVLVSPPDALAALPPDMRLSLHHFPPDAPPALPNRPSPVPQGILLWGITQPAAAATAKNLAAEWLAEGAERVLIADADGKLATVHIQRAGVVLAAGQSSRYGSPKQVLSWRGQPFVRAAAQTALAAGLNPVLVITGAHAPVVRAALAGLPVRIVHNPRWAEGQSTSIHAALHALEKSIGAVIFLLADQPQITPTVLRALTEAHSRRLTPVLAPLVNGRRANPVLFDARTFPALKKLVGDVGGRGIFSQYAPDYIPWLDENLLQDVDNPADYARLIARASPNNH